MITRRDILGGFLAVPFVQFAGRWVPGTDEFKLSFHPPQPEAYSFRLGSPGFEVDFDVRGGRIVSARFNGEPMEITSDGNQNGFKLFWQNGPKESAEFLLQVETPEGHAVPPIIIIHRGMHRVRLD